MKPADPVLVTTKRGGGMFEAAGTIAILGGMIYGMSTPASDHVGGVIAMIGFVVFIIGRFN